MTYFNRASWGAAPPKSVTPFASGLPNSLTVHAVGANVGMRDDYLATCRSIQAHAFGKGLSDIDYNFLVDFHGNIYEGRGPGTQSGAQGKGNTTSLAVCVLDNGDGDVPFTAEAKQAILALRDLHVANGRQAIIHPHRWWNSINVAAGHSNWVTSCPGDEISAWCANPNNTPSGGDDMPLSNADFDGMKATVGNYVIGTLQGFIIEQRKIAVRDTVAAVVAKLPVGSVDGKALAKVVANELAARLQA